MSFFDLSDNSKVSTDGNFEIDAGGATIPNDTTCLAMIDEAGWADYQGDEYINLRWVIAEPKQYANRKVFQKIRVYDADAKKADKAKKMLIESDWSVLPDVPMTSGQKILWIEYRRALREIKLQAEFPDNINWPKRPE